MNIKQIEYIIAIAEEQSLVKAADKLFVSQAALSQHLAKLKKEGIPPLFYRHNGKLLLTDSGKIYINGARHILNILDESEKAMASLKSSKQE